MVGAGRLRAAIVALVSAFACLGAVSPASAEMTWSTAQKIDRAGSNPLASIACPKATACVAGDSDGRIVEFTPGSTTHEHLRTIDPNPIAGVSCLSSSQCLAVGGADAITFDPDHAAMDRRATVDPGVQITAIACPKAGTSGASGFCVGVDSAGRELQVFPNHDIAPAISLGGAGSLTAVTCTLYPDCVAVDTGGNAISFNAEQPVAGLISSAAVDPGHRLQAVSCSVSTLQCAAVDNAGRAVGFLYGSQGLPPTDIDGSHALSGISCHAKCVAVDDDGQALTFDPFSPGTPTPAPIDGTAALGAVHCRSDTSCTAVDRFGREVAFGSATPQRAIVDQGVVLDGVSCLAITRCIAIDERGQIITFDPASPATATSLQIDGAHALTGLSCRVSTDRCVAVDDSGSVLSFDASTPGSPAAQTIDQGHRLIAVSCPLKTQCTTIDDAGGYLTFDPAAPGTPVAVPIAAGHALHALSCPSQFQCTAVDDAGREKTFDPEASASAPQLPAVDLNFGLALNAITCRATTLCIAAGASAPEQGSTVIRGDARSFNPTLSPAMLVTQSSEIDSDDDEPFVALSCQSMTSCATADAGGRIDQGDPASTLAPTHLNYGGPFTGLTCPSFYLCVAVDPDGNEFRGRRPAPVVSAKPTISGTPKRGVKLTRLVGSWTNSPTSYATQWLRCGAAGGNCASISGAHGAKYKLTAGDVGRTIRVKVTATNPTGAGKPARSAATAAVVHA